MKRAILLVDHGSRRPEANALLASVAAQLAQRVPDVTVRFAHMDLAEPTIAQGITSCVAAGAEDIVVHPYFLAPGNHSSDDIPRLVRTAAEDHPQVRLRVTEPLGLHPKLVDVILDRIAEAVR